VVKDHVRRENVTRVRARTLAAVLHSRSENVMSAIFEGRERSPSPSLWLYDVQWKPSNGLCPLISTLSYI
jgi:hypothetical protein